MVFELRSSGVERPRQGHGGEMASMVSANGYFELFLQLEMASQYLDRILDGD